MNCIKKYYYTYCENDNLYQLAVILFSFIIFLIFIIKNEIETQKNITECFFSLLNFNIINKHRING